MSRRARPRRLHILQSHSNKNFFDRRTQNA
jgi:hypothetical protein